MSDDDRKKADKSTNEDFEKGKRWMENLLGRPSEAKKTLDEVAEAGRKSREEAKKIKNYQYEPADGTRARRYEYKVETYSPTKGDLGGFMNYYADDGWQLSRGIDSNDLGDIFPTADFEYVFVFERPIEEGRDAGR